MADNPTPIPLTYSRTEQIFPVLTPAQMRRVAGHGRTRVVRSGEVLVEQGDTAVPLFLVVKGELQAVRPSGAAETLITILHPGQFTGEVNMLSGRRNMGRIRVSKP